mgnify:FL=1
MFHPALAGQPHVLTRVGAGEGVSDTGDLDITDDLIIAGDPSGTEIDGNQSDRVFDLRTAGITVTFERLFITGGNPPPTDFFESDGGGIRIASEVSLTLEDCAVFGNSISNGTETLRGGGISSLGRVTLRRSEVVGNSLSSSSSVIGGGIYSSVGEVFAYDSRISDNRVQQLGTAISRGAGIALNSSDVLELVRTEVANNVADGGGNVFGGGIRASSAAAIVLTDSTISSNIAQSSSVSSGNQAVAGGAFISMDAGGRLIINGSTFHLNETVAINGASARVGGLSAANGDIQIANSIFAGNLSNGTPFDCFNGSQYDSLGFNIVGEPCFIAANTGDQFGTDPLLDPLADNGGANPLTGNPRTHALQNASPAIDAGNPALPGAFPACSALDQRGFVRPGDTGQPRCDIGAHEFNSPGSPLLFRDGFED